MHHMNYNCRKPNIKNNQKYVLFVQVCTPVFKITKDMFYYLYKYLPQVFTSLCDCIITIISQ